MEPWHCVDSLVDCTVLGVEGVLESHGFGYVRRALDISPVPLRI